MATKITTYDKLVFAVAELIHSGKEAAEIRGAYTSGGMTPNDVDTLMDYAERLAGQMQESGLSAEETFLNERLAADSAMPSQREIQIIQNRYTQGEDQFIAELAEKIRGGMRPNEVVLEIRQAYQHDRGGKGVHPDDLRRLLGSATELANATE